MKDHTKKSRDVDLVVGIGASAAGLDAMCEFFAPVPTLFLSNDHRVLLFTPAAREIYKLRPADRGRPLEEITNNAIDMPPLPTIDELGQRDEPIVDEICTQDRTWYIRRVFAYRTGDEERRGMVVTFSDVTELKETTEELQKRTISLDKARKEAESASQTKSEFLANMSHEIRTPMTAILGYADILLRRIEDFEDRRALETIQKNANFLLDIINDILDVSKIEEGNLPVRKVAVNPRDLIEDLVSMMGVRAREKNLELKVEVGEEVPPYLVLDPTRIRQILLNLVGNAVKFTEKGSVLVQARFRDSENPTLCCQIRDTGMGMTDEVQREIFKPFSQSDTSAARRHEGTGLGLTISRRIAEALGGTLNVESEVGRGSTFTFEIPAPVPTKAELEDMAANLEDQSGKSDGGAHRDGPQSQVELLARVLAVDDREEIHYLVRNFLEAAGASVETAGGGKEALQKFRHARLSGFAFDAVVMDMQMPDIDGYEATRRLRDAGFDGPILALTAAAMLGDSNKCFEAGCTEYLTKPIDADVLIDTLSEQLGVEETLLGTELELTPPVEPAARGQKKILLVEDNRDVAEAMSMMLELNGLQIHCAYDGQTAIEAFSSFRPDVVLVDLGLPDMTGYDVLEAIKEIPEYDKATIMALSGRGMHEDIDKSRAAGFDDHLVKPVALDKLVDIIFDTE